MLRILLLTALVFTWVCGCSDAPIIPNLKTTVTTMDVSEDTPCPAQAQATLYSNKTPVGTLSCWVDGSDLYLEYRSSPGVDLVETQFSIVENLSEVPVNPAGKPIIGHFPYKQTHASGVSSYVEIIGLGEFGMAENLYIVAHADLLQDGAIEGAWAGESMFPNLVDPGLSAAMKKKPGKGNQARFFLVNIPALRGLLLWNTLDSEEDVVNSAMGPNGLINGDLEYPPCVYGNGFQSAPRTGDRNIPSNYVDYPVVLQEQGTLEFWYAPTWDNWSVGHVVAVFFYGEEGLHYNHMAFGFNDWQNLAGVYIYGQSTGDFITLRFVPSQIPEWSTDTPFHVAITWDLNQTTPEERLKLFFNGVNVATRGGWYMYTGDPQFTPDWSNAVLRMSSRLYEGDWDRHHWEGASGVLDNLKAWSCVKTDFSDRFQE